MTPLNPDRSNRKIELNDYFFPAGANSQCIIISGERPTFRMYRILDVPFAYHVVWEDFFGIPIEM